jgi:hypothetical protein
MEVALSAIQSDPTIAKFDPDVEINAFLPFFSRIPSLVGRNDLWKMPCNLLEFDGRIDGWMTIETSRE